MNEEPKLHYSTTFWSVAPGHDPYQLFVMNQPSLWKAWWYMTKMVWKCRRKLNTLQKPQEKADPTQIPSGEQPIVTAE